MVALAPSHAPRCAEQDGDHSYIRLNFNFGPGYEPCVKFPGAICLKELSFRTADTQHAAKVRPGSKSQPCLITTTDKLYRPFVSTHSPASQLHAADGVLTHDLVIVLG